jgi:hypothetical protein
MELQTRAVLLKVVLRPEVLRRWRSTATCAEEEGGEVNLLVRRLELQISARGRGDDNEPFLYLGWRREWLRSGWPRRAEPAWRKVKQSSGGMA